MKKKAFIFGADMLGKILLPRIESEYDVIGFLDNGHKKIAGGGVKFNYPIYNPDKCLEMDFDTVIIATVSGLEAVTAQLLSMGVKPSKIVKDMVTLHIRSRICFLEDLGVLFKQRDIHGCVAEGGVFRGDFAKEINRVFYNSRLFLFDTFEGFSDKDTKHEKDYSFSEYGAGHFSATSEELVIGKLPYPENCVICKGYFPETTKGLPDESFCFVNLDFDLYQPILAGLEYFIPRMVPGGVILIHDYYGEMFKGVKQAIEDYEKRNHKLSLFPIGDMISVGIMC